VEDINARRGGGPGSYFPGASARQQARLDQAIARSENALTQIRQYEPDWRPREQSLSAPGSVEGAISRVEARAAEAELRLDQVRSGIGGNFSPPLNPLPRTGGTVRVFDGGAWIDVYRTINNVPNLFGEPAWPRNEGTVAVAEIDGSIYFGVNREAPGYTLSDYADANERRWKLINRYPNLMATVNIGQFPNNALYHAEATILMRSARGKSLFDQTFEIHVDRPLCPSCEMVMPLLGLELGNPTVTFVNTRNGVRNTMRNGRWLQ
jgi:hypothetical protein